MPTLSPYHLLLVLIAAIWGSGFVAQRFGMESLGPYSFNAARFVLATLSLIVVWSILRKRQPNPSTHYNKIFWLGGLLAGLVMFAGFSFQQVGLQYTTAGNAGFITSTYIVLVPLVSLFLGQTTRIHIWIGILLALAGLYVLSVGPGFHINRGDWLELMGAFFWAAHVVTLGWLSRKVEDLVALSIVQFAVAAVLSVCSALMLETHTLADLQAATLPLLYSSLVVSGLGFTLQIIAQRHVDASVAALVLSLEAVFALLAGWLLLGESVGAKELSGCGLMLAGILISQWPEKKPQGLLI